MLKKELIAFPLCLLLLISTGCGLLSSSSIELKPQQSPVPTSAGFYFLPKTKIILEAERKSLVATKTVSTEKTTSSETTQESPAKPTNKHTSTESQIFTRTTSGEDIDEQMCTLTLKDTRTEADPQYLFSLEHIRNAYAEDHIDITMTTSGLLTKVELSAEDKLPEFFSKLGELAKESAKAAASLAVRPFAPLPPFHYIFVVDPTEDGELKVVNDKLAEVGCNLKVSLQETTNKSHSTSVIDYIAPAFTLNPSCGSNPGCNSMRREAIFFRPALPYLLSFETSNKQSATQIEFLQHPLSLPNKAPILALDLKRVRFGTYTSKLTFQEGMLTQVQFTVPSSAVGFMKIPIEIAKTIASIPGEIIQLKFDITQKEKNLVNEQAGVIEAQKSLLEKQEELRQYMEELRKKKDKDGQTDSGSK